jgi:hypothetical protein
VNPSVLPPGSQFLEDVTVFGPLSITITNPIQVVGVNAPEASTMLLTAMSLVAVLLLRMSGLLEAMNNRRDPAHWVSRSSFL